MNTVLAISLSRANQLIPFHVFQFSGYKLSDATAINIRWLYRGKAGGGGSVS